VGFTPILLLVFCGTIIALLVRRQSRAAAFALAVGLACVVIALLSVQTGGRAHWEWFFRHLPGADALRVPARFLILISPAVVLVAVYGLSRLKPWIAAVLFVLIAAEQYSTALVFAMPRQGLLETIRVLPEPPAECRSFYVRVPKADPTGDDTLDRFYIHSTIAMFLAEYLGLPTVNGMATFTPAGWDLHGPFEPNYPNRVLAYADRMAVRQGLCALDLKTNRWTVEP
jgi:hypothetical protein